MAHNYTFTDAESRYVRKWTRLKLGLRKPPVPRRTNGVLIPEERVKELRAFAESQLRP